MEVIELPGELQSCRSDPYNSTLGRMSASGRYCRKRFFWRVKKFFSAAGASRARRCEGPRRITRDRPQSFVRVLLRLAAAEATKNRLSRDFASCSIFDFFDSRFSSRSDL